jgi:hypothetical protein
MKQNRASQFTAFGFQIRKSSHDQISATAYAAQRDDDDERQALPILIDALREPLVALLDSKL